MKKLIVLFLLVISIIKYSKAQDPVFSQNLNTRTYLNPAIAGTDSTLAVSMGYRNQWPGIDGTKYITLRFSADQYVRFLRGGLGLDAIHDVEGPASMTTKGLNLNYAPHFELFNKKLAVQLGFKVGYFENTIDTSKIILYHNGRTPFLYPYSPLTRDKVNYFDFSSGIFMYTKKFYGGIGLFHMNQPDEGIISTSRLPVKVIINVGANISAKSYDKQNFILSPNIIFRKQQDFQELMLGLTAKYKWFVLGLLYENRDAFVFNTGLQFKYFKFGYSYDITISKLTDAAYGSHEVQLIGFIPYTRKPCKIKTIRFI